MHVFISNIKCPASLEQSAKGEQAVALSVARELSLRPFRSLPIFRVTDVLDTMVSEFICNINANLKFALHASIYIRFY